MARARRRASSRVDRLTHEVGQPRRTAGEEHRDTAGVCGREVERAGRQVSVPQEGVAAPEVDEVTGPGGPRRSDTAGPRLVAGPVGDRRTGSRRTSMPARPGRSPRRGSSRAGQSPQQANNAGPVDSRGGGVGRRAAGYRSRHGGRPPRPGGEGRRHPDEDGDGERGEGQCVEARPVHDDTGDRSPEPAHEAHDEVGCPLRSWPFGGRERRGEQRRPRDERAGPPEAEEEEPAEQGPGVTLRRGRREQGRARRAPPTRGRPRRGHRSGRPPSRSAVRTRTSRGCGC